MKNWRDYIAVDPNICHGQVCFKGTRIMVYLVLELLEEGLGPTEIREKYYPSLSEEAIKAGLHYASELIKSEEYSPLAV